ncbi:hypothetical protein [Komagataeibacter europaeus]|uniref:hypothetical protein n=1 Tax=Komagataeibacter europaeus TaxID=33995 RepID=UPI0003163BE6|nr:hypothetical protein [Komagataeibacter europaeus]
MAWWYSVVLSIRLSQGTPVRMGRGAVHRGGFLPERRMRSSRAGDDVRHAPAR